MNDERQDGRTSTRDVNARVIDELRANNGRVGGDFEGVPLLLMTTQGRTTGRPHTTPVVYRSDGPRRHLVFASNGGAPEHPDWYRNLQAHPQVTVEVGTGAGVGVVKPYAAVGIPLGGSERDEAWERQCALVPAFRAYQARTTRTIPVVALQVLDLAADPGLVPGMGAQLLAAHEALRTELAGIRAQVGEGVPLDRLRRTSLTWCYGLQVHHIREEGAFTLLEERFPQLGPAVEHLRSEHHVVDKALADFEAVLTRGPLDGVPALTRALDAVTDGLDEHFAYEEEHLLPTLSVAQAPPPPATPAGA